METITHQRQWIQLWIKDVLDERWVPVFGYEGVYEISYLGRIKSVVRIAKRGERHPARFRKMSTINGYLRLTLRKDGTYRTHLLHKLVARTFLGPCPVGHEVNHIDRNRKNPWVRNLEYVTHTENVRHSHRLGAYPLGEERADAKLTDERVRWIRKMYGTMPRREIATRCGVTQGVVWAVYAGKTWKHVV